MLQWPRVSIVTPSYNQGTFIEETIRSVLLQGYPDLEYIIIDGGSSDQSVPIIKKYEPWLSYWVSEKDHGQADAINKGFAMGTGEIGAYLNSDDLYLPGAFRACADSFTRLNWELFIGMSANRYTGTWKWMRRSWWLSSIIPPPFLVGADRYGISQESTFWNKNKFNNLHFDENFHFCLDVDWYCRISRGSKILLSSQKIGYFRHHADSKTARLQEVAKSEHYLISTREILKGINKISNNEIWNAYRWRLPFMAIERLLLGDTEFLYIHPR
jgi:glycosyltransferase involved in cell wall biosynthesis